MANSILTPQEIRILEQSIECSVPDVVKFRLLGMARRRFGRHVYPAGREKSLATCFKCSFNRYSLWFNDANNSTRIVSTKITLDGVL